MEWLNKVKAIYKVTDTHVYGFFNEHRYLSGFHLCSIEYEGITYPSTENAYQAAKIYFNGGSVAGVKKMRTEFASITPSAAKSKGRSIPLREDWLNEVPQEEQVRDIYGPSIGTSYPLINQVRDKIMYDLNVIKFSNPYLRNLLLSTGDKYLEETNWWRDDYWGVCNGQGLNKLGRILMKIRDEIKSKQKEAA